MKGSRAGMLLCLPCGGPVAILLTKKNFLGAGYLCKGTQNPKKSAEVPLNPKPETRNPKPETLNPRLSDPSCRTQACHPGGTPPPR